MIEAEPGSSSSFWQSRKGSTAEVKCQLYVALDQRYIDQPIFTELSDLAMETGKIIGGLMKCLRRSGIKGTKYKTQ
jgi:four helix bundle protein